MNSITVIDHMEFHKVCPAPSSELMEKAQWLIKTYECFRSDKPPPHKQRERRIEKPQPSSTRTCIGKKELTTEAIAKKQITTLMNKMSPQNKDHIISQVRTSFRTQCADIYVATIWEFMLICPEHQDLYTDVLLMLPPEVNTYITDILYDWLNNKRWLINVPDDDDYTGFCDYVKSKKRGIAAIKGFGYFVKKRLIDAELFTGILHGMYESANTLLHDGSLRQFEVVLEQFKVASLSAIARFDIEEWISFAPSLPPSIRFKIYDLRDKNL